MTNLTIPPSVLSAVPPFSALPDEERALLLKRLSRRTYAARAVIVDTGQNDRGLTVLLSGHAKLTMTDPNGRQVTLGFLGPGDLLLDQMEPSGRENAVLTATATARCEVLHMPATEVAACISAHPGVALPLMAELARQLRRAYEKIARLAFQDVRARVAHTLLDYATLESGTWNVPIGAEELARTVGASREMVSRVLRSMQTDGVVRRFRRRIEILDRSGVLKECAPGRPDRAKLRAQVHSRPVPNGTPPLGRNPGH